MITPPVTDPKNYRFPVELQKIYTVGPKGGISGDRRINEVPRSRAVVRLDTLEPLCTVSDRYELHSHAEVMDAAEPFVNLMGEHETTYSLEKNGMELIATHTFKHHQFKVAQAHGTLDEAERAVGDIVSLQLHVINSYNKSKSVTFRLGGKVLRCLNGMTFLKELFEFRFSHVPGAWDKTLPDPQKILDAFQTMGRTYTQWGTLPITGKEITSLVKTAKAVGILPQSHYAKEEHRFIQSGTIWDLYNAFTYVITHTSTRLKQSGQLRKLDMVNQVFQQFLAADRSVYQEGVQNA